MTDSPATVLVAADDRTIRRNLVRLLQAEGYHALEAADGEQALTSIRSENPDAVLLDLKMPGRDGLEVLGALGPALADLPVIVVTAFGGSAVAIEAMRRGAYDYLTKPFDLDEVLLTLKRALRQRALAHEVQALRADQRRAARRFGLRDGRARIDRPERGDARGLQGDRPGGGDRCPGPDRG
jgi:two-component system response regulator AtoC